MVADRDELVILAHSRQAGGTLYLLRLDRNGQVIWARDYRFLGLSMSASVDRGTSRLVMIGDSLWITGASVSPSGDADMILLRTDLNGIPGNPCVISSEVSLAQTSIPDPMFIREYPDRYDFTLGVTPHMVSAVDARSSIHPECITYAPVVHGVSAQICPGETFAGYSASGIYTDTFPLMPGCDSIRILHLAVVPWIEHALDTSICSGAEFEGYSETGMYLDTFVTARGCDSIRVLNLTLLPPVVHAVDKSICTGAEFEGYAMSGIYLDTFVTAMGCDSIRQLTLSVVDLLRSDTGVSICEGDAYEGYALDGIYLDTFVTMQGCDSIRTLTLTVIPIREAMVDAMLCAGGTYEGYSAAGVYVDTLVSASGCDSIRSLTLSVVPAPETALRLDACAAAEAGFAAPGVYRDTVEGADGCDSIRIIEVTGLMADAPNVFSPNQDGINDVFEMDPSGGKPDLHYARLFDRYGGQIFEQRRWPVTWDGRDHRGRSFPPGVYTLVIRYVCGAGETVERGTITLLK
jgi:gliding motility-associated-like protein